MKFHFYEPASGHGLRHNPLNAIIAPRPIGWISTRDKNGGFNLAPYSFFNTFNYDPPILGFASTGWKHTVQNAMDTGEFVWNLVTGELGEQMNMTSEAVARGVDEFQLAGLTPAAANRVSAPRVAESRASMECKVVDIIQLRNARRDPLSAWLVIGEVVGVHIDLALLKDGVYQTALAHPLMRCGGLSDYALLSPECMVQIHRTPNDTLHDSHGSC
jgi:flavin reductase (DIM6/NTAB) family NADH-FMN oxidoreductase RutF